MDRDAQDYAYSLEGSHTLKADALRREAYELDRKAKALLTEAEEHDERARWAREMADALTPASGDKRAPGEGAS